MKLLTLFLCSMFMAACSSIVLHSDSPKFSGHKGGKILVKDVLLCQQKVVDSKNYGPIDLELWPANGRDLCLEALGHSGGKLAKGTKVTILDIEEHKYHNIFQFQHWYFIGEAEVEGETKKFYYHYALSTTSPDSPEVHDQLPWH